jgi:hypothetical protein
MQPRRNTVFLENSIPIFFLFAPSVTPVIASAANAPHLCGVNAPFFTTFGFLRSKYYGIPISIAAKIVRRHRNAQRAGVAGGLCKRHVGLFAPRIERNAHRCGRRFGRHRRPAPHGGQLYFARPRFLHRFRHPGLDAAPRMAGADPFGRDRVVADGDRVFFGAGVEGNRVALIPCGLPNLFRFVIKTLPDTQRKGSGRKNRREQQNYCLV